MEIFSKRLKMLREDKQLSALALSKILKVSHSTFLRWENNTILPGIEHLYNIAVYLGVSADYLLGLED